MSNNSIKLVVKNQASFLVPLKESLLYPGGRNAAGGVMGAAAESQ